MIGSIHIVNDAGMLFSSSYLLGLLKPLMDKYPDKDEFKDKLILDGLDPTNRLEILRAINRYYHSHLLQ